MSGFALVAYEVPLPDPLANLALLVAVWLLQSEHDELAGLAAGVGVLLSPKVFLMALLLVIALPPCAQRLYRYGLGWAPCCCSISPCWPVSGCCTTTGTGCMDIRRSTWRCNPTVRCSKALRR